MDTTNLKFEDIPAKSISYKSIEKKLKGYIEELKAAPDFKSGMKVIHKFEKYNDKLQTNVTVINIRYTLNTTDKKIAKLNNQVDEVMPLVSALYNEWNKLLLTLPYRADIEKKYTPHKVYDDCPTLNAGRYWMRQSHIFCTPFYYIDYTLAQVVAFQFLIEDRKNHEKAWKKYVKLCKSGGKYPFCELLEKNHLRNPFDDGNLHKIMGPLNKIIKEFDPEKL